jgi:hypothetical protein
VQPLDTNINKPFKDSMRSKFNKWLSDFGSNATLNATRGGRLKAPDYETIITWVLESIENFPPGMISRAFKNCRKPNFCNHSIYHTQIGYTTNLDGSDSNLIDARVKDASAICETLRAQMKIQPKHPYSDDHELRTKLRDTQYSTFEFKSPENEEMEELGDSDWDADEVEESEEGDEDDEDQTSEEEEDGAEQEEEDEPQMVRRKKITKGHGESAL